MHVPRSVLRAINEARHADPEGLDAIADALEA